MTITKFEFHDKQSGWKLNAMSFDNLNLLVGLSGVGKTKILKTLEALEGKISLDAEEEDWKVEILAEDGSTYTWEAKTSLDRRLDPIVSHFVYEKIIRNEKQLVLRDENEKKFTFKRKSLPRLDSTESAISLLRDEEFMSPLLKALNFNFSKASHSYSSLNIHKKIQRARKYDSVRNAVNIPLLVKAYILQEDHPKEFETIKEYYSEIFNISDIRLEKKSKSFSKGQILTISVKESKISNWIISDDISSGMMKTLLYLFEIALAPKGSVIMIDDFENSMGQNCLPQLTDYILRYSNDIQFILTSHHPYVINNIPTKWWKIVTRKGSEVTVKDADSIPALKTGSKLDKFTLLMNLKEYEEGIQ